MRQARALVGLAIAVLCVALSQADRLSVQTFQDLSGASDQTILVSSADVDQPQVLFDSGLQSWFDQQLQVMDQLQSLFAPRTPCGGRRSSPIFVQEPVFAYMASSRFGPSLLTTFMEQVDEPEETWLDQSEVEMVASEDESVWSSVFESTGAEAAVRPLRHFPDWLPAEKVQGEADDEAVPRTLFAPGQPKDDFEEDEEDEDDEDKPRGKHGKHGKMGHGKHHHHMASCGAMIASAGLLFACVVVWGCLLRTAIRCSRMMRKNKAVRRAARREAVTANPLLTPLVREASLDVPEVAVAGATAIPAGSYYQPYGSQLVTVAYQPLRGE